MRPIPRRAFIVAAVGALGYLVPSVTRHAASGAVVDGGTPVITADAMNAARAHLSGMFGSAAGARRIGSAYLASAPHESGEQALLSRLTPPASNVGDWWTTTDGPGFVAAMRERTRADFASGDTWAFDGWTLSRTEGRLAALLLVA